MKGDSVAARATWGQSTTNNNKNNNNDDDDASAADDGDTCSSSIAALAAAGATDVSLRVAMVDAELFSLRLACAAQTSYYLWSE